MTKTKTEQRYYDGLWCGQCEPPKSTGKFKARYRGIIYISGPMGIHMTTDWNFSAFHRAAHHLRKHGFVVINPAELDGGGTGRSWSYYIERDKKELCKADAIVLLPRWKESLGVAAELKEAEKYNIPVHTMAEFKRRFCSCRIK